MVEADNSVSYAAEPIPVHLQVLPAQEIEEVITTKGRQFALDLLRLEDFQHLFRRTAYSRFAVGKNYGAFDQNWVLNHEVNQVAVR